MAVVVVVVVVVFDVAVSKIFPNALFTITQAEVDLLGRQVLVLEFVDLVLLKGRLQFSDVKININITSF